RICGTASVQYEKYGIIMRMLETGHWPVGAHARQSTRTVTEWKSAMQCAALRLRTLIGTVIDHGHWPAHNFSSFSAVAVALQAKHWTLRKYEAKTRPFR